MTCEMNKNLKHKYKWKTYGYPVHNVFLIYTVTMVTYNTVVMNIHT